MQENQKVVTRFAPSPTGFMHIGGARTALYAYLLARKYNGTFILRIEDTDRAREVPGSLEHLQESLKWLGIDWDYGPDKAAPFGSCIQSERMDTYQTYARKLLDKGLAYPDPYTEEEVAEFRKKAEEAKQPFLFRNHRPATFDTWDGKRALRFKVPEIKEYRWTDAARGELHAGPEALDDFILIKADGYPTYNFAHIIDDHLMGVTHVMRADEYISSIPKYLSLYEALEIERPILVTLPPILRKDRTKKLGKRDGAKDLLDYKKEGYLPDAVNNFLAFIGWNPGTEQEIFTKKELIETFSIERIGRAGAIANEDKLDWINKEHLKLLSDEEFWNKAKSFIPAKYQTEENLPKLKKLEPIFRERIEVFGELSEQFEAGEYEYFFETPTVDTTILVWKTLRDNPLGLTETKKYLTTALELLDKVDINTWNKESIKGSIWDYAELIGRGAILWPLRVTLSGREKSPDPFELADILGKNETLARINKVLNS